MKMIRDYLKRIKRKLGGYKGFFPEESLDKRISEVERAIETGERLILYFYDQPSSTVRYRLYNVYECMKESQKWKVAYFSLMEYKRVKKYFCRAQMIVLVRTPYSEQIKDIYNLAKKNNVKVVCDFDDLLCNKKWMSVLEEYLGESLGRKKYWIDYIQRCEKTASLADGFIVTNDFLGQKLKSTFKKPFIVVHNSLNKEQVETSKKLKKQSSHGFMIGYYSGSSTHKRDFEMVESEVLNFLDSHADAKLVIMGQLSTSRQTNKYIKTNKICFLPFTDYIGMLRSMEKVDVNIAPLVINDFTNCKSELKFFEAAVVETTTIASPSFTFKEAIKDGENGFLAKPGEWYDKLEYLYKHPEENKKIAKEAHKYAIKHYYGDEFRKEVEEAYDYFAN